MDSNHFALKGHKISRESVVNGDFGCQRQRDLKSEALKMDEMSWESGRFGGHRLEGKYLKDLALTIICVIKSQRGCV